MWKIEFCNNFFFLEMFPKFIKRIHRLTSIKISTSSERSTSSCSDCFFERIRR